MLKSIKKPSLLIFLCLCLIALLSGCASHKTIVHDLDEKEANEVLDVLARENIEAVKVKSEGGGGGGQKAVLWDINVPFSEARRALSVLNQSGFPRRRGQSLLGIFKDTGLVPSEMAEKVRFQAGLAESIATTLRKIDGVLDAEVNISFPEEDPLNPQAALNKKVTASVYIKHSGILDDPNIHLDTKIKRFVAASVPNLDYDNVTVIMDRARFGDTQLTASSVEAQKNYQSIWGIIIAEESATSFRILFFTFCIALLLLFLICGWLIWKLYPILKSSGGIKQLFSISSLKAQDKKEDSEEELEPLEIDEEGGEQEEKDKGKGEPDI